MENGMNGMEEIRGFLRGMKFKPRTLGGCDQEDVLDKIEILTQMYGRHIDRLNNERDEFAAAYEEALQREQAALDGNRALRDQIAAVTAENAQRESTPGVFQESRVRTENERTEILLRAEREARRIVFEAEEHSRALLSKCRQEMEQELAAHEAHGELIRQSAQAIAREHTADVANMKTALGFVRQHIADMLGSIDVLTRKLELEKLEAAKAENINL